MRGNHGCLHREGKVLAGPGGIRLSDRGDTLMRIGQGETVAFRTDGPPAAFVIQER